MASELEPGDVDREAFGQLILERLKAAGETAELEFDAQEFQIRVAGDTNRVGNLGNVYNEYRQSSEEQQERLLHNYVRSWFAPLREVPADFEDVQPDLLPTVRARAYIELNVLQWKRKGADRFDWPYRPLGGHLALSLVYDLPGSLMQIQQRHLDDWKVTFEEALERALHNLMEISNHQFDEVGPGVWQSPWKDNLDASRLVLPGLMLAHEVQGDPVVMVPNRDTLLLTGADNEAGLTLLADLAEQAFDQPRSITGVALRLDPEAGWLPFLPDEDHEAYEKFRVLQLRSFSHDYQEQKIILDHIHEETGEDVFVASYAAAEDSQTGELFTYCVWSEGIDSMLPRTDRIVFVQEPEEEGGEATVGAVAPWWKVVETVPELLGEPEGYPPRWRVRGFPTGEQLGRLGAEHGPEGPG